MASFAERWITPQNILRGVGVIVVVAFVGISVFALWTTISSTIQTNQGLENEATAYASASLERAQAIEDRMQNKLTEARTLDEKAYTDARAAPSYALGAPINEGQDAATVVGVTLLLGAILAWLVTRWGDKYFRPNDPAERLKRLAELHKSGLLTDDEFKKKRPALAEKL